MSTQTLAERPSTNKPSALGVMAAQMNVEPDKLLNTLKATVFKGASNEELLALVVVANTYGLNPLLKEIYAFPAKGGGIVPVVSIDGWISMVNRQPNLDGLEFDMATDGSECTCCIYIKGRSHAVKVTEYLSECARATDPWRTMPKRMLRHKSLIQAARVAFGFSGIYDEDEAKTIGATVTVSDAIPTRQSKPTFSARTKALAAPAPEPQQDDLDMGHRDDEQASAQTMEIMPEFTPDTPQKQLAIAVSDYGCPERVFMTALKKQASKVTGAAVTIRELSDEAANVALDGINDLLQMTEGMK